MTARQRAICFAIVTIVELGWCVGLSAAGGASGGAGGGAQLPLTGAGAGSAVTAQLCDLVTGCSVAYSMQGKLVAGYAGSAFKLSRTGGGGGTQDIGFSGTTVNTSTIATFCNTTVPITNAKLTTGAYACKIQTWYDQSGYAADQTSVNCDVPLTMDDTTNLPVVTTGAAINNGTSPCFLNNATDTHGPSGNVDASVYAAFNDGALALNTSCGFFGKYHAIAAPDTAGTDYGMMFRQDVAGFREFGADLEQTVAGAWVGSYSKDSATAFSTLGNPNAERLGMLMGVMTYVASTKTQVYDFMGGERTYTYSGTWPALDLWGGAISASLSMGNEIRTGAGGDGCATEAIVYEGVIWPRTISSGERAIVATKSKTRFGIASAPNCGNRAATVLGASNISGLWGLARIDPNWRGGLVVLQRASDNAINVIMANGCDIDTAAIATFCNATTCHAERLINQVPKGHIEDYRNGTADLWHLDQPTYSGAPTLTQSCLGSLPCLTFTGSETMSTGGGVGLLTFSQPYSLWSVANRTSGSYGAFLTFSNFTPYLGGGAGANQALFQADSGGGLTLSSTDGAWHSAIGTTPDGTHVTLALNGTRTTSGTVTVSGNTNAVISTGGLSFTGTWAEGGFMLSAMSTGNESTIATKQCSYWGFTTC